MLRLEHIGKIYPTGEVLKDVTWEVKPNDRIGLVGVNGAGNRPNSRSLPAKWNRQQAAWCAQRI
jgi:ABC-type uncharacterized transport system ATPase subunit